jgi:thiol-disulfide isomerase/thioredoxin
MPHTIRRTALLLVAIALTQFSLLAHAKVAGEMAPDYLGDSRQHKRLTASEFRGTPMIVTYWASWCGPCLRELPILESLQKQLGTEKLRVIAVNIEDRAKYRAVARKMWDWTIEVANDPHKEAHDAYGVKGIPHLVVIGRDGVIRKVFRGYGEKSVEPIVREVVDAINEDAPQPK